MLLPRARMVALPLKQGEDKKKEFILPLLLGEGA
jgi:hypothetical protein